MGTLVTTCSSAFIVPNGADAPRCKVAADLIYLNKGRGICCSSSFAPNENDALAMTETASKTQILLAQLAVALMIAFVASGLAWYGFSAEVSERIWQNLLDRPGGPMTFRFILQPIMATIAALYDGVKDARTGRSPYLWTILSNSEKTRQPPARGFDLDRTGHSIGSLHGPHLSVH